MGHALYRLSSEVSGIDFSNVCMPNINIRCKIFYLLKYYVKKVETAYPEYLNLNIFPLSWCDVNFWEYPNISQDTDIIIGGCQVK